MIKKVKSYLNAERLFSAFILTLFLLGTSLNLQGQILNKVTIVSPVCQDQSVIDFNVQTEDIEQLSAGWYEVIVTTPNGECYGMATFEVMQPYPLTLELVFTEPACNAEIDGCAIISGGTAPYAVWVFEGNMVPGELPNIQVGDIPTVTDMVLYDESVFDPNTSNDSIYCANNIPDGNYLVLVIDAKGCYTYDLVTIEPGKGLELSIESENVSCHGFSDGMICYTVFGSQTAYEAHLISENGTIQANWNNQCFENLPEGIYTLTVFDNNGCHASETIVIEAPNPITMEFIRTSEACSDQVDGCLLLNGGTQPYHLWVFTCETPVTDMPTPSVDAAGNVAVDGMTPTDAANFDNLITGNEVCAQNIPAGTYYVLVMDANGCWAFEANVIAPAEGITGSGEVTNVACDQSGAIDLTISGANPPYYFQWSNGATTEDIEDLSAGIYTVQVYGSNDFCSLAMAFTVEESEAMELDFSFDTYGEFACVEPIGGTAPFTIEWLNLSNGNMLTSTDPFCIYNIQQGVYIVTVTDSNGCSLNEIFAIEEKPCNGGVAIVDPAEITSGDHTVFQLLDYSSLSIQWQFKMDFTNWLDIPGATSDYFITPPINMGLDNEVEVRAVVICDDGTVLYSTVDILYIIGSGDLTAPTAEKAVEKGLFNWEATTLETKQWTSKAFPTVTNSDVNIMFNGKGQASATITITDFKGKVLDLYKLDYIVEGMTKKLALGNYTPGMYFITVSYKDFVETHRVFIER